MRNTVLTVLAGLVLAGAATAGVVAAAAEDPAGTPGQTINLVDGSTDTTTLYDTGE